MSILRHPVSQPAVLVAMVSGLIAWLVGGGSIGGVIAAAVVGTLFAIVMGRRAATVVRKSVGARPAHLGEFPRFHNTVDGLCLTHGIEPPALSVVDSSAGNALAIAGPAGAELVLTTGAVDHLGLVELESLVAHLLARSGDPDLRAETARAGLGSLRVLSRGASGSGAGRVLSTDFAGADLTRFPPGMQDALRSLVALGSAVESPSGTDSLWLLQPDGLTDVGTADHPSVEARIDALGER
ncbi:MAG: hypothetical protein VYC56_00645 [Actinomycetota bacterium]|nr:hypothetical protein [Actinomycetota bacterium]MEC9395510.1 hypothetical protein [Actinomycetota bacterium]MEE2957410.1 hypothetical protein [Actinomycetota bacterium]